MSSSEEEQIRRRYERRNAQQLHALYNPLSRCNALWQAELHTEMAALLSGWIGAGRPLQERTILEVGCGSGGNLLDIIGLGADPAKLIANDLLEDRLDIARHRLPASVTFIGGDATRAGIAPSSVDLVLQFTVFSSILDEASRQALARRMWEWLRPDGAILSYDLAFDNPRNPDVRKVSAAEISTLFPGAHVIRRRVTLAPPIARRIAPLSTVLFAALAAFPFLRSHNLCLIQRSDGALAPP